MEKGVQNLMVSCCRMCLATTSFLAARTDNFVLEDEVKKHVCRQCKEPLKAKWTACVSNMTFLTRVCGPDGKPLPNSEWVTHFNDDPFVIAGAVEQKKLPREILYYGCVHKAYKNMQRRAKEADVYAERFPDIKDKEDLISTALKFGAEEIAEGLKKLRDSTRRDLRLPRIYDDDYNFAGAEEQENETPKQEVVSQKAKPSATKKKSKKSKKKSKESTDSSSEKATESAPAPQAPVSVQVQEASPKVQVQEAPPKVQAPPPSPSSITKPDALSAKSPVSDGETTPRIHYATDEHKSTQYDQREKTYTMEAALRIIIGLIIDERASRDAMGWLISAAERAQTHELFDE